MRIKKVRKWIANAGLQKDRWQVMLQDERRLRRLPIE
jgi:hypothetical protein